VVLLVNPKVTAAADMNVGIWAAKGDAVCRADSHTLYASDYVSRCVAVLTESGADNVGGRMRPVGVTAFGWAIAAATSSSVGVGPGRFHYHEGERIEVDTVYLGCWWRSTLEDLGGYDEDSLQWAAEDHELNFRIRRAGGRIVLDPSIRSWYFPRETPGAQTSTASKVRAAFTPSLSDARRAATAQNPACARMGASRRHHGPREAADQAVTATSAAGASGRHVGSA